MVDERAPQVALELGDQFEVAFHVLERRVRGQEVARIGQAIAADRSEVRQPQRRPEVLADIAARDPIGQRDPEADPARDHRDLVRLDLEHAELGRDVQASLLRHDQQLAIGVVEEPAVHVAVGRVQVDADARLRHRSAIAGQREQAVDEIHRRGLPASTGQRQRIPAQLVRGDRAGAEVAVEAGLPERRERAVHRRRPDPVQPATPVLVPRCGERSAGELFGVQAVRDPLRRVAPDRQGARERLAGELVAEPGLVTVAGDHRHMYEDLC
jgi:hypothetical protein